MSNSIPISDESLRAINPILVRQLRKIMLPGFSESAWQDDLLSLPWMATLLKNIQALGFTFTPALFDKIRTLKQPAAMTFYEHLVPVLRQSVGAHKEFAPMYPNFPEQVMEMDEAELYINAMIHYLGDLIGERLMPHYDVKPRPELVERFEMRPLGFALRKDVLTLGRRLIGAKSSISATDKEDLAVLIGIFKESIDELLPEEIAHKENLSVLTALLMAHKVPALDRVLGSYFGTATDVLRLATALSEGDVSLATNTKFRTFKRPERRLLLALVERCGNPTEDMLRHKGRWIRLGEKLHPGEYRARFPKAARAFDVLRKDQPFATFASRVEAALRDADVSTATGLLGKRPGELARRLDHLLRLSATDGKAQGEVVGVFKSVCERVSTPVLLQVHTHFTYRNEPADVRAFFPKGNAAKVISIEHDLDPLPEHIVQAVVAVCEGALMERFGARESLGKVYLDERLRSYLVPFSQRSASKALRTLVRGSHLPIPQGDTIRFFLWWKEGQVDASTHTGRVDIDLSAAMYDENWEFKEQISYTNLRSAKYKAAHSGDITSAPKGACEFIDLDIASVVAHGGRYVVMNVYSFTSHSFCDLPECFAGWMMRKEPKSGEIFDARAVVDKVDLAADTRVCIPVVLDLVDREVIWTDLGLKRNLSRVTSVEGNSRSVAQVGRAIQSLRKPSLHTLFGLHMRARATEIVDSPELADTVFSVSEGATVTPFDVAEIMSDFL